MQLCLVGGGAGIALAARAALAGLAARRHGLPLQADLRVGRRTGAGAGVGRRGRRRQRAEGELAARTAGQLCGGMQRKEEEGEAGEK